MGNIFLTSHFRHFDFELFDTDSISSNLCERLSIIDFLVCFFVGFLINLLMCQCISLKMLKSIASGLILMNTQLSSLSNAFCLCIS